MKTAITLLSIMLAVSVGTTSCRKSEASALQPLAAKTTGTGITEKTATLNYNLTTSPADAGDCMHWDAGYLTINEASFQGSLTAGNCIIRPRLYQSVGKRLPLFTASPVTSISVSYNRYFANVFGLTLFPQDGYSLLLSGMCRQHMSVGGEMGIAARTTSAIQLTPVQLRVTDPLTLAATLPDSTDINMPSYNVNLVFKPSVVLAGVTPVMLDNATTEGGVLVISATSNRPLYDIMIANLANALGVELASAASGSSR